MANQLALQESEHMMLDIQNTQKVCNLLMQSPHYKRMGAEGVFAIVEKAKSIGVSPMDALNGGMYFMRGRVEMSSALMNQLIRQHKHSISKDRKSSDEICILHGKRADNGDTWVESFSMEEAKRASLTNNSSWKMYPKDMLFARALSRLARQLFPDIIKGCYIQGEISMGTSITEEVPPLNNSNLTVLGKTESLKEINSDLKPDISDEEFKTLNEWLGNNDKLRNNILACIKKENIEDLRYIPRKFYDLALQRAKEQFKESQQLAGEHMQMEA